MIEKIIVGLTSIIACTFLIPILVLVSFGKLAYAISELKPYFVLLLFGFFVGVIAYFILSFYF